jgi:hypothetical protein
VLSLVFTYQSGGLITGRPDGSWMNVLATGKGGSFCEEVGAARSVALGRDGLSVATGISSGDGQGQVYHVVDHGERRPTLGERGTPVNQVIFCPRTGAFAVAHTDGIVKVWDPATGRARPGPTAEPGADPAAIAGARTAPSSPSGSVGRCASGT